MTFAKTLPLTFLVCAFFSSSTFSLPVCAWVPAYSIGTCKTMLQKDFGGVGMKDALTYLPLQFYKPSGPALSKIANDADIKWFIDWGNANNVKVELCIFNYISNWDWPAAVSSYKTNRAAFIAAVMAEVDRMGYHGVDIDFEGPDVSTSDRDAYYVFCTELAALLHAKGKVLTYATFPAQYNAPNWTWWNPTLNTVDGIGTMGYDWSGRNKDYLAQAQHASVAPWKLMIGMPGWVATWQGNTVNEQIDWVVANGTVGVCIWDATLGGGGQWQQAAAWNKLKAIHDKPVPTTGLGNVVAKSVKTETVQISRVAGRNFKIDITLQEQCDLRVTVFDMAGREVVGLYDNPRSAGTVSVYWNGFDARGIKAASGPYVLMATANGKATTKRFVLM